LAEGSNRSIRNSRNAKCSILESIIIDVACKLGYAGSYYNLVGVGILFSTIARIADSSVSYRLYSSSPSRSRTDDAKRSVESNLVTMWSRRARSKEAETAGHHRAKHGTQRKRKRRSEIRGLAGLFAVKAAQRHRRGQEGQLLEVTFFTLSDHGIFIYVRGGDLKSVCKETGRRGVSSHSC
jgi:hypothetical protein